MSEFGCWPVAVVGHGAEQETGCFDVVVEVFELRNEDECDAEFGTDAQPVNIAGTAVGN